eukprot:TRINITY_DN630_c0_g1_i3.p1 TRINITY_DN630_c0_g1~~TRINITY_DN630_c0_g1_i3.p1  ORF type:complete len:578 (+),score=89.93 TRINITY_DN630_c0_g1_i3:44-1777(+)
MGIRLAVIYATLAVCNAGLIGKYYSTKDCTGNFEWRVDDTISFDEASWKYGPRGRSTSFCVEWTGEIDISGNPYLWLDADDGVLLRIGKSDADLQNPANTIIDKWNSYDQRPCPNPSGCKASTGRSKILIRYYQDFGPAHITFKWGPSADYSAATVVPATSTFKPANPTAGSAVATLAATTCCYPNLASCGTTAKCSPTTATPGVINPRLYARVGEATDISKTSFWDGKGLNGASFFTVSRCSENLFVGASALNTNLPNDDNIVLEVTMGTYVDYFKPLPGKNLCDMLMSGQNHLWSATGDPFTFVRPAFHISQTLLGGSDDDWPLYNIVEDNRKHLAFWGGNGAQGGCCHAAVGDSAAWNRGYVMRVFPLLPGLTAPTLSTAVTAKWTRIAWVSGLWNTETGDATKPWNLLVTRGLRDTPEAINNGRLYFVRKCGTFDSVGDKLVMKICFAPKSGEEVECDLFRPTKGNTLCEMLQSRAYHEWSYDNGVNWVKPDAYTSHAGGSAQWWPKQFCSQEVTDTTTGVKSKKYNCTETRQFLPFWAGYRGGYNWINRNGNPNTEANQAWSRDYTLSIKTP